MNRAIDLFLKAHTLDDIRKKVSGELLEDNIEQYSYWYGNGELIVSDDSDDEAITYVLDSIDGVNYRLVEY